MKSGFFDSYHVPHQKGKVGSNVGPDLGLELMAQGFELSLLELGVKVLKTVPFRNQTVSGIAQA